MNIKKDHKLTCTIICSLLLFISSIANIFLNIKKSMAHKLLLLSFIFLLFSVQVLVAQKQSSFSRQIDWKISSYNANDNTNETHYLNFDGAIFPDYSTRFPYFSEVFYLSGNKKVTAKIVNHKYQPVSSSELSIIGGFGVVGEEFKISQNIFRSNYQPVLELSVLPLRKNSNTGQVEKLISFDIQLVKEHQQLLPMQRNVFRTTSVLSSGKWVKVGVTTSGIYQITNTELQAMGFSSSSQVRIFGNGGRNLPAENSEPIADDLVECKTAQSANGLVFYAEGPEVWSYNDTEDMFVPETNLFSRTCYYYITSGNASAVASQQAISGSVQQTVNTYLDLQHYENEAVNLVKSGRYWYGEHFETNLTYDFTNKFVFKNIVAGAELQAKVSVLGRSNVVSTYDISIAGAVNTISVPTVTFSHEDYYAKNEIDIFQIASPSGGQLPVSITYNQPNGSSEGWLDFITLNVPCELKMVSNSLKFCYKQEEAEAKITLFSVSNATTQTKIWNVTDFNNPVLMNATLSGEVLSFKAQTTDEPQYFIAFNESGALSTITSGENLGEIENQNLHSTQVADMIIVAPEMFMAQAQELADFHKDSDQLDVVVVNAQKIYNEFSSGIADAGAIRNFVKMVHRRATQTDTLRYLLLFGDGSYDNLGNIASNDNNSNILPTYQSYNSLSYVKSFVADDFFGLLDDDEGGSIGFLDIGVGRFPVQTTTEAANILNKIYEYAKKENDGIWQNQLCFLADDEDNNNHMEQADELTVMVRNKMPGFNTEKIFADAYKQVSTPGGQRYPTVNQAISNAIRKGAVLFNYTGHGNEIGLGHENFISMSDVNSWTNFKKLPLFITATCEFSRYDDWERTSAGENVLLNPRGGGIALLTTTRLVYSTNNARLNKAIYKYLFLKDNASNGKKMRLGDAFRFGKIAVGNDINKRNFSLLGDPALCLNTPNDSIYSTAMEINSIEVDTIQALEKVTVSGALKNRKTNETLSDFNGYIYSTVFDKETSITTLSNDGNEPFTFDVQNNILYKGKASVTNGAFSFTFIVPKDIAYKYGKGKISYFAYSPTNTASGYNNDFIIGGSSNTGITDTEGPEIKLYLNDENFFFGGITDENPKIIAYVTDESGINTVGNGIGHDITAMIDDETSSKTGLNESYIADLDSYQSGKIEYNLSSLSNGLHSLKLKVWDVVNNSSEAYTEFIVSSSSELIINRLFNYPNPFTTKTSFYFEHNQPYNELEVLVQIFTLSGKLIKTIDAGINSDGFLSEPIPWDGLDDYGDKIGRGAYVYKLKVRTPAGKSVEKIEKLVILR